MMLRVLSAVVFFAALSVPAYAEDAIIPAGRDVVVNVDEPHLLTPVSAAKKVLACCPARDELADALRECAREKERLRVLADDRDNPGLSLSIGVAVAALAFAGGVWVGSR